MPLASGLVGAIFGTFFVILTVNQLLTITICALVPVGPFILLAIGSLIGFFTSLTWFSEALKDYPAYKRSTIVG